MDDCASGIPFILYYSGLCNLPTDCIQNLLSRMCIWCYGILMKHDEMQSRELRSQRSSEMCLKSTQIFK